MKEINGDSFLMNVFLELIRRKKMEISFINIIKLEYDFLNLFEKDDCKVILKNSGNNIIDFVQKHKEYLELLEKDGELKIFISNEEEFKDLLLEKYEQDFVNIGKYRKALKMEINREKKAS